MCILCKLYNYLDIFYGWPLNVEFLGLFKCLIVRPSVRLSGVCKQFTFSTSSQEPLGQIYSNLTQLISRGRGFIFVKMEGLGLLGAPEGGQKRGNLSNS